MPISLILGLENKMIAIFRDNEVLAANFMDMEAARKWINSSADELSNMDVLAIVDFVNLTCNFCRIETSIIVNWEVK